MLLNFENVGISARIVNGRFLVKHPKTAVEWVFYNSDKANSFMVGLLEWSDSPSWRASPK